MFESAAQDHTLDKAAFAAEEPALREALLDAQFDLVERKEFALLVVMSGIDGAGKSQALARLYKWLDPHHLRTHAYGPRKGDEKARPRLWRYWRDLPAKGEIGVAFGSWYREPMLQRIRGKTDVATYERELATINGFEAMLTNEGIVILKLWFVLPADLQHKRLKALKLRDRSERHVLEGWGKNLTRIREAAEAAARLTSTGHAPWLVIPSADARYRDVLTGKTLIETIRKRLTTGAPPAAPAVQSLVPRLDGKSILDGLDLSQRIESAAFKAERNHYQARLAELADSAAFDDIAVVAVFEGSDAAGKGGSIRRVTAALDPRRFRVVTIAAPTDEERARPYLWRFWRHVPAKGSFTIFDRSWYGRVLVERVEGFCSEADWLRAYGEINAFEAELAAAGIVVVKFWLTISAEEQFRRFKDREQTGFKRHKITPEDWRNREKWGEYALAVSDMVDRTGTHSAPWTLVEAEDKNFARIKVLKTLCERIEATLAGR
jgi:polyphosphate:AMP phosphotransferase